MTPDQWQERLSAMMDGELSAEEMDALLKEGKQNPRILAHWQRLHQQAAHRQRLPEVDVVSEVNRAIDRAPKAPAGRSLMATVLAFPRRLSGVRVTTVAASFTALVVLGVSLPSLLGPGKAPEDLADRSTHAYWDLHHQYASFETGMRWQETEMIRPEEQP
ncbi:MAG: RseA family anti-sigma factor [Saccharospirillum sp.]